MFGGALIRVAVLSDAALSNPQILAIWQTTETIPAHTTKWFTGTAPMQTVTAGVYCLYVLVYEYEGNFSDSMCVQGYCPEYAGQHGQQVSVQNGLDYKNGTLVVATYSFRGDGSAQWYLSAGSVTNNTFTATAEKFVHGQCLTCAYSAPSSAGNHGTVTIRFTSSRSATMTLPGRSSFTIVPYF